MLTAMLLLTIAGQQSEAVAPPPPVEKKICKAENTTGTRLGSKRVCRTQAEWDQIAANARNEFENGVGRLNTASGR
ncbi:hypothetical protein RN629_08455 [Sphingomonadaceae bacterium jetA1]|jgi:hypothetical protein|uniref:hypothetical protein n=1 Tax=Facivitalis istanbulensis TaxID=3075838 RepID=UPI0034846BCE